MCGKCVTLVKRVDSSSYNTAATGQWTYMAILNVTNVTHAFQGCMHGMQFVLNELVPVGSDVFGVRRATQALSWPARKITLHKKHLFALQGVLIARRTPEGGNIAIKTAGDHAEIF